MAAPPAEAKRTSSVNARKISRENLVISWGLLPEASSRKRFSLSGAARPSSLEDILP
jgi:hypothetical protein